MALATTKQNQQRNRDWTMQYISLDPKLTQDVIEGVKQLTVHKGIRKIEPGNAIFEDGETEVPIFIYRVEYKFANALIEGYIDLLKEYYPDIAGHDKVTCVYFHYNPE